MILIDIMIALSVGVLFVAVLFESSSTARSLFVWSRDRSRFMDIYEAHADEFEGMVPSEVRTLSVVHDATPVDLVARARWYGNDRIETEVTVGGTVTFSAVRAYPFAERDESVYTPICSVDLYRTGVIRVVPILIPGISGELTDIEVRNTTAYISVDSARVSDPDFVVVDIASSSDPRIISSIHTGPGMSSFSLVGRRIFAVTQSTVAQVQILGLDDAQGLHLEQSYVLVRPSTTTPPTVGSATFVADGMMFVGTEKWQGNEFIVLDVSDPLRIVPRGMLEIGGKVTDIISHHGTAYVTDAAAYQMIAVDVTDPSDPVVQNSFEPPGWSRQEGKTLSYFEEGLTLGRTSGGFDIRSEHELFSWASTSPPSGISSWNMPGGAYGIVTDRMHTFVASRQRDAELQVFGRDMSTGPIATYPLPALARGLVCDGDRMYMVDSSTPTLYEISFN
ncbi:MAG: hypothetical protein AAB381_02010 [Patescibacteria group bacterium]